MFLVRKHCLGNTLMRNLSKKIYSMPKVLENFRKEIQNLKREKMKSHSDCTNGSIISTQDKVSILPPQKIAEAFILLQTSLDDKHY